MRRRLDVEMVRRGLVESRAEAARAIAADKVTIGGRPAGKASTLVSQAESISLVAPSRRFVSRGGQKLEAALDRFGVEVRDRRALDGGSSTGGFVDCLLQRGAAHVVAVDVGYGQLDWRLRVHQSVTVLERKNVRDLRPEDVPYLSEIVTADLSFISLRLAIPSLQRCAIPGADFILLVKPQFEAGRHDVNGGVVKDPSVWLRVLNEVAEAGRKERLVPLAVMPSPILGPAGNVEFLLHAKEGGGESGLSFDEAVNQAAELASSHA